MNAIHYPTRLVWDYNYQDICPEGDAAHSDQKCAIMEELTPDEAGLPRYRVRFNDGFECEALEPEITRMRHVRI
jgi:hypothetical protein